MSAHLPTKSAGSKFGIWIGIILAMAAVVFVVFIGKF